MIRLGKIEPAVTHRCCPSCGYLLTQHDIEAHRIDFMCPRCEEHRVSEFQAIKMTAPAGR